MFPKERRSRLPAPLPNKCIYRRNHSISPLCIQKPRRKRSNASTLDTQLSFMLACVLHRWPGMFSSTGP